jgi:hypothetical protein
MKNLFIAAALLASYFTAQGQGAVTLLTFESFTFADRFETYYGYGQIGDGFQWGAGLEFEIQPGSAIELIYQRQDATAYYDSYYDNRLTGKIGINYILLGATGYKPVNDAVSLFGTFDMGAAFTSNIEESLNTANVTKFAIGGRVGLKIAPSDKISLRIHAQLLSPVQWFGGGFYFGTGGSGAGVTTGSTIFQFNLGGSVNYRLK